MKLTDLTVTRVIPAPPAAVRCVDGPQESRRPWFGAERTIIDPVVDGLSYFAVKHEGRPWAHYGRS
jgi:hypothetical protein